MVEILSADIGVGTLASMGDSGTPEHNVVLVHTVIVVEPSGSRCTVVVMKNVAGVQPASVVTTG